MSALAVVIHLLGADQTIGAEAYPVVIPERAALPCIVVNLIAEDQNVVLNGSQNSYASRVSVACHAGTATAANALGEAVKSCLGGVINAAVDIGESPALEIGATILKAGTDLTDYSDDRTVFRRILDFNVRWWRI
jgi:hypothetical protein